MSKRMTLTFFAVVSAVFLIPFSGYAVDYPHADTSCTACHPIHGGAPWSHPAQNIDDTYYNNLCWYCHNDTTAPYVKTHSSLATDAGYGTWTVECRVCHEPHRQRQFWTYGSESYLFSGAIDAYVSGDPTSTITRTGANWTQDEWAGTVVFILASPSFSSVIISNTSDTLTLQGPIYAVIQPGTTQFAIVYGGLVADTVYYQKSASVNPPTTPPTTPISASVKFFRATGPDSFADGVSTEAICEVCHTQTTYHKNDGTGAEHNPATKCTECHLHTEGFKASCTSCHGQPPVDTATLVQRPADLITGSTTAGAHGYHVSTTGYGCTTCHMGSAGSGVQHMDDYISLGFSLLGGAYTGGAYDGQNGVHYNSTQTETLVSNSGTKRCSSIYCHSDGTSVSTGAVPGSTSPAWDSPGPLACTACHGFPPSYTDGQPKANSHRSTHHRECNLCHYGTTANGMAIADPAIHVNGSYSVEPDTSATFDGVPVSFSYSYSAGGGTCSTVSCHGGGMTLTWGADQSTLTCTGCHTKTIAHLTEAGTPGPMSDPASCKTCHLAGGAVVHVEAAFDIAHGCGQCHWTGLAPYFTEAQLATVANGIHESAGVNYQVAFSASIIPNSLTVNVTATVDCGGACPPLEYDWDWGDGSVHGTANPESHTYASAGAKTITLTVKLASNHLNVGTASRSVTIPNPDLPPTASNSCGWNPNTWTMTVTDTSTDDGPDGDALPGDGESSLKLTVSWGDSSTNSLATGAGAVFSHVYANPGSYTVTETVTDSRLQSAPAPATCVATAAYFTISGTVKNRLGTLALSSANVQLQNASGTPLRSVLTNASGQFSFGSLRPATYRLRVTRTGYTFANPAWGPTAVGPDATGITIYAITP